MIALYLNSLENSQLNRSAVAALDSLEKSAIVLNDSIFPTNIDIPIFSSEYINHIDGEIITFDLNNTLRSIKALGPSTTTFYVWDLEWLRGNMDYLFNIDIYQSVDKLLCRSISHQKAIQNYCNRKAEVININEYIIR